MSTSTQSETFTQALGKIVSGVYVLTVGKGEAKQGVLVSWVAQAGFTPPAVTIALEEDRDILKNLAPGKRFILNIVNEDNTDILKRFSKYQADQFDNLALTETEDGAILKDTTAYLVCELKAIWTGDEHHILYAHIANGEILNADTKPWVHIRKNGLSY